MSGFAASGRLATWDGTAPNLREWSDDEILGGLRQLGIDTDREQFAAACQGVTMQASVEDAWLEQLKTDDQGLQVFAWMAVEELWERWRIPVWPKDRLARMFAYLVDSDYSVEWADRFHAPSAAEVFDALEAYLAAPDKGVGALEELVEMLGMPAVAWPSKMLEGMTEWAEVGNHTLAERGGAFMARHLGHGHALAFQAAALVSARMLDRAQSAALEVPLDAPLEKGFDELVGYLSLAAGDAVLGDHWLRRADAASNLRKSEMTFAAEAIRDYLKGCRDRDEAATVPDPMRAAARQAAAQACYYAFMAFAGNAQPGGGA